MSTRGWVIFKYKGKYYVFYNHHDSYPEILYGLCSRLIQELNKYTKEQLIELLENFLIIIEGSKRNKLQNGKPIHGDKSDFETIENVLTSPFNYTLFITDDIKEVWKKDIFIEYKYIINLDEELFTMTEEWNNIQLHFPLFNIQNDWYNLYCKVLDAYRLEE